MGIVTKPSHADIALFFANVFVFPWFVFGVCYNLRGRSREL